MLYSCLVGLGIHIINSWKVTRPIKRHEAIETHRFANDVFITLKDSDSIRRLKNIVPRTSAVGFYSDIDLDLAYMCWSVMQNLLAPILVDKFNYNEYRYIIMALYKDTAVEIVKGLGSKILLEQDFCKDSVIEFLVAEK